MLRILFVMVNVVMSNLRGASENPFVLFKAARLGHASDVEQIVSKISTINLNWHNPNRNGDTPLHAAVDRNHITVVRTLINAGADPNVKNRFGATPMHEAATVGNVDIGKVLTDIGGARLDIADEEYKYYPLDVAYLESNDEFAAWLESKNAPCSNHCSSTNAQPDMRDDELNYNVVIGSDATSSDSSAGKELDESWFSDVELNSATIETAQSAVASAEQMLSEDWFED